MKRIFAAATATALLFVAPLPASSKPASEETGIEIEITELTPVHSPGEALPLTIEVTNPGPAIAEASLHITAQASVPSFRNTMTSWLADTNVETTMMTLEAQTIEVPSGTTEIEFEIPAEIFTWGNTLATWGPRGIEASLEFEGARTVDRSILVTEPSYEQEAMPFTALVPITVGGDDLAAVPTTAERYEDSLLALESGELGDNEELPDPVIEAVQGSTDRVIGDIEALTSPGITLALDSSLAALEYGTLDLTEEALTDFADADHHELVLLPALDTDVAAWAQTGYDQYFATHADQMQRSTEALNQRDIAARTDLLFTPVSPSLATAALGLENGANTVVIDSSAIPSSEDLYWTPSAHTRLELGQESDVLLVDNELSALLLNDEMSDVDKRQALLALTAIHYRERPNDSRPLVLALPRADRRDVDLADINELIGLLDETAWLDGATASDIEETPIVHVARGELTAPEEGENSVTARHLEELTEASEAIFAIGDLTTSPYIFRDAVEATYSVIGSWSLSTVPGEIDSRVESVEDMREELAGSVSVQESSTINLISQASELPVHVTSTLPFPITVDIDVQSEDRRLRFTERTARLQPDTTTTVGVPVRAIGSGDVTITVEVQSSEGHTIGAGTEIKIRVRADWETLGTAIIAGIFLIILIIGIVRSARRGKRSAPVSEADTIDLEE